MLIYLVFAYVSNFFMIAYLNKVDGDPHSRLTESDKRLVLGMWVASPVTWFFVTLYILCEHSPALIHVLSKPFFFLVPEPGPTPEEVLDQKYENLYEGTRRP